MHFWTHRFEERTLVGKGGQCSAGSELTDFLSHFVLHFLIILKATSIRGG